MNYELIFVPLHPNQYNKMGKTRRLVNSTTKKKLYIKGSDFCLDLAKLVFGGIILAGIMGMDIQKFYLLIFAALVLFMLVAAGAALFIKGNQKQ